ncbi:MAG: hypothetical protein IPJ28_20280 [Betaproteobacteria bacterium]|nr:hypothetical protein [Betaproteobacteria bacterium]
MAGGRRPGGGGPGGRTHRDGAAHGGHARLAHAAANLVHQADGPGYRRLQHARRDPDEGRLDVAALERVLADLVARHECLRMRFLSVEGAPRCTIDPDARVRIERVDLGHLAGEAREAALARETAAIAGRPFDLACAPLLHAMLVRLADEEHVFFFVLDHIIGDGLSVGILLREFQALYSAHATGRAPALPPLAVQYLDYVEWERGWLARGALDEHRAFWLRRLAGMPPVLALPTDRPRPSMQTAAGARLAVRLPVELAADLKTLARAQQATLFATLLSAFQVLLYRHSRQADFESARRSPIAIAPKSSTSSASSPTASSFARISRASRRSRR